MNLSLPLQTLTEEKTIPLPDLQNLILKYYYDPAYEWYQNWVLHNDLQGVNRETLYEYAVQFIHDGNTALYRNMLQAKIIRLNASQERALLEVGDSQTFLEVTGGHIVRRVSYPIDKPLGDTSYKYQDVLKAIQSHIDPAIIGTLVNNILEAQRRYRLDREREGKEKEIADVWTACYKNGDPELIDTLKGTLLIKSRGLTLLPISVQYGDLDTLRWYYETYQEFPGELILTAIEHRQLAIYEWLLSTGEFTDIKDRIGDYLRVYIPELVPPGKSPTIPSYRVDDFERKVIEKGDTQLLARLFELGITTPKQALYDLRFRQFRQSEYFDRVFDFLRDNYAKDLSPEELKFLNSSGAFVDYGYYRNYPTPHSHYYSHESSSYEPYPVASEYQRD